MKGATDHFCLENCSGAKYKIFTVTFLIFNRIIFRFDGFQASIIPFISTIHMVAFVHYPLEARALMDLLGPLKSIRESNPATR